MKISVWRQRRLTPFVIFTALLTVLAVTGAALSIVSVARELSRAGDSATDTFVLVPLGSLAVIVALSVVSWRRRRNEVQLRRITEAALRESERKYRDLVEKAPVGIVVSSFDGKVIDVNETLVKMHGYDSKDEFLKSSVSDRFGDLKERDRWVGVVWDAGKADGFEMRAKRKDGSLFWTSTTALPRTAETGEQQIVAVVEDVTKRKDAESALAESEAKFRILAEQSPNMIFINQGGHVVYANKRCTEIMRYRLDEFYSPDFNFLSLVNETSRPSVIANYKAHEEGREVPPYEYTLVAKDGTNIECILMSRLVEFRGRPAILGTVTDITERKRAERALAFKTALLEAQSETTVEGILVVDENDRIVLHNKRFRELWGLSEELIRNGSEVPALHYVLPQLKDPEAFTERIRYLQAHKEEHSSDQIELKDGRVFERYSSPLVEADGTYRGRVRYFRDVTEARNASHKLEIAAEEWRRTFDSISDAVSIQDSDFRLVKVNRAYARMLGKEPQDLLGKRCYEVVHQCERPVDRCPHQHTLKTGEPGREEFYEPNLGVFLEVTTSPVFDEDGKAVGSVHVARDITARREMQDQLLLADRLSSIGELVSGVAHELNNPLTRVVESSYLLMERELPEEVKEDVGVICGEARRAARIVRDLVSFAGKHAQVKQVCRLNDIVEDVLRLRAYQQSVSNIEVARRLSPDLPDIMVDCFQIQQVFLNIIINAEYFMTQAHQHGTLTVSTERLGGILRASFADDGPGITPENIGRVFNPFFTTKEAGKGTGLGLSVSHRIVAEHGGRIYVNSRPGAGATFVVELPPAEGSGPKQSEGGQPGPA